MKFDPQKHHHRSIRLKGYDYCVGGTKPPTRYAAGTKPAARQSGAHSITIVTVQRGHFFGEVVKAEMGLNELGEIVCKEWY